MTTPTTIQSRFGFHSIPFTREFPIADRFSQPSLDQPLAQLERAVAKGMSAILVGPAGSGKTALLRALRERLAETRFRVHYFKVTDLAKRDLCREICTAIGTQTAGNYPALVRRLQEYLASHLAQNGVHPILLLDTHDFRPDTMAILRLLTNYEMDSRLVVSLVLVGQNPLRQLLRTDQLKALADRLAHFAQLRLLSRDELFAYIQHRCRIAGAQTCPFDNGALQALHELSSGNFRACDQLALKALELANDRDVGTLSANLVSEARGFLLV